MDDVIYTARPSMPDYEEFCKAIKPLWETHMLTNMGKYHCRFEEELKKFLKVPECSLMVNGHMSLEMAIQAFGFPRGAEVITTPFTFISTTHAIVRNNLTPVFCDIKLSDGTIDEDKIEDLVTENTVAILPVHVYGNICNIEAIETVARKYNLKVIYDAAHAFGMEYKDRGIGSFGDASIFSFHATKVFNTVEGGAITSKDRWLYEKIYNLKNFGIRGEELVADVGANAKLNELCAIMGLCNLENLEREIHKRENIYNCYLNGITEIKGIEVLISHAGSNDNYAYFPIVIKDDYKCSRDELYDIFREKGIYARKYFYPLTSDQACFKNKYRDMKLEKARWLSKRVLTLPMYADLQEADVKRICAVLKEFGKE